MAPETPPGPEEILKLIAGVEWLRQVGVTTVVANPTAGPDGCRGWTMYVGWGGAGLKEAPSHCWRQGPQEGVLQGWGS